MSKRYVPFVERVSSEGILRAYASIEEAFARGDYQFVARHGATHPELQGAAYVLIGNPVRGLDIFERHHVETAYSGTIKAFAHWYVGDEQAARSELDRVVSCYPEDELARRFRELLLKDEIAVLVGSSRPSVLAALKRASGFRVTTVGFPGQDVDLTVGEGRRLGHDDAGRRALAESDFFFLYDQGVPVPADLAEHPLPCLAFLPDAEMHLANMRDEMALFDGVFACSSQVRLEMEALYGARTFACPIFASLSALHEPEASAELPTALAGYLPDLEFRPIDILFTGSIATPMYQEKPPTFLALSQIPGRDDIRLFDRAFPLDAYKRLMKSAKCTVVSIRLLDTLSTRAIQALQAGTLVLTPEPSALDLYFEWEKDGFFPFDPNDPEPGVRRVLNDYGRISADFALRRDDLLRRMDFFCPPSPEIERRWLKLAAFHALQLPQRAKARIPVNVALNWWTERHFGDAAAISPLLLVDRTAADWALKDLVSAASQAARRNDGSALRAIASRPQPMPNTAPGALPWRLIQAFALHLVGDDDFMVDRLEAIWRDRNFFVPSPWDGLVWFNFNLGVWLRHYFLSEAQFNDAVIAQALRDGGYGATLSEEWPLPHELLLSGIAGGLGYYAIRRGAYGRAREWAAESLALFPRNAVAKQVTTLAALKDGGLGGAVVEQAMRLGMEAVAWWPWYLQEFLPALMDRPDLDALLFEGRAEEVFLRFFQRVRTDRGQVSALAVPEPTLPYLRAKLGIRPSTETVDVLDILRQRKLDISFVESLVRNVAQPLACLLAPKNGQG